MEIKTMDELSEWERWFSSKEISDFFEYLKSNYPDIISNKPRIIRISRYNLREGCQECYNINLAPKDETTNIIIPDLNNMPFPNKSFDVIILEDVLDRKVRTAIGEIRRILSDRGIVFIRARRGNELSNYQGDYVLEGNLRKTLKNGFWIKEVFLKHGVGNTPSIIVYAERKSTSVREMRLEDATEVLRIVREGWKVLGESYPEYSERMLRELDEANVIEMLNKGDVYLMEIENSIVGVAGIIKRKNEIEIGRLFIDPTLRGLKLGTEMMLEVFKRYRGKRVIVRSALYPPTLAFYLNLGFRFKKIENEKVKVALLEREV